MAALRGNVTLALLRLKNPITGAPEFASVFCLALTMLRTIPAILLVGLVMLVACQPNQVVLEVTRLVEIQERVDVEVTRIVSETVVEEATRLVTEELEVVVEVTKEPLGTEARPVQLLFPPLFEADLIVRRGEPLAEALSSATGYQFRVGILDDEQAVIDLMCAAPADTAGPRRNPSESRSPACPRPV